MKTFVLVAGGFHAHGAMDRANYELALHLTGRPNVQVHLVSHSVARSLADRANVTWHAVPRPFNSYTLGEPVLAWKGRRVCERMAGREARVIVNGGNCAWPDVNWVHALHANWEARSAHAPLAFRLRDRALKRWARRSEYRALARAKLIVTNSKRTRDLVLQLTRVQPERAHAVYLGVDPLVFRPPTATERARAREELGLPMNRIFAGFIGPLGYDQNKGLDILLEAWKLLCRNPGWDVDLLVAGGGRALAFWRQQVSSASLVDRVHLVGFTTRIPQFLASIDALVSPVQYESYGLSVHEALCSGVPAFVTRTAGIAERYPSDLDDFLMNHPPDAHEVAERLRYWRRDIPGYRSRTATLSQVLRRRTWNDMAKDILHLIETIPSEGSAGMVQAVDRGGHLPRA